MRMFDLDVGVNKNDDIVLSQDHSLDEIQNIIISKEQGELVARAILELCLERRILNGEIPEN